MEVDSNRNRLKITYQEKVEKLMVFTLRSREMKDVLEPVSVIQQ